MSEIDRIEKEKSDVQTNIGRLKKERDDLETMINSIKKEASRMRSENSSNKDKSSASDSDDDDDDSGERQEKVSEQSKTFCVTCGTEQAAEKAFKHWYQCHKKQESVYNFTSDQRPNLALVSLYDNQPDLYCERECEKKGKIVRYCMHVRSACPQHSNWQPGKDEVCGCPTDVMQELRLDGNYCLELKSECNQHYNWDKFRLAMKDMERIQEFNRLHDLTHKSAQLTISYRDTYGGVVGVMLHDTKDYHTKSEPMGGGEANMIDVD